MNAKSYNPSRNVTGKKSLCITFPLGLGLFDIDSPEPSGKVTFSSMKRLNPER